MYYSSIGLLCIAVHLIINFQAMKKRNITASDVAKCRYRQFLFGVMLYYSADVLWGILYEKGLVFFAYADTVIYFFSMVLSVLLWTRFVIAYLNDDAAFGRFLMCSGWGIFTFELIALIMNAFSPVVFGFGEDGEYYPGTLRYFTLAIQMALFFLSSVYTFLYARKKDNSATVQHRAIGFSGIIMTAFIALQTLYPLLPFYAVGCLLSSCMIHSFVYWNEKMKHDREMGNAKKKAYADPLTGVKNKLAYLEALSDLEIRLQDKTLEEYGVVVFDLNDLKKINDAHGHDAGDESIKDASNMICRQYKHSPVFRIGGDEFAVILEGEDYNDRDALLESFDLMVEDNLKDGKTVVAGGMAIFSPDIDNSYNDVFRRADKKMYERKMGLKTNEV